MEGAYLSKTHPENETIDGFSEVEAFDFIFGKNHWIKTLGLELGFRVFGRETINRLKDIFLHNLMNKKLIKISEAQKMQRYFKIVSTEDRSHYWYKRFTEEREKNRDANT